MNSEQIDTLKREVLEQGNVDAMCALADLVQETDHPHKDELVELASTAAFFGDPACALTAGANFLLLYEDVKGKLPKAK